ncbi:leucine repeat adapter protein 25-like [Mytilus trossulus]|uniref:leucine repeat adapter protein 25-like n=1 Tax=Mytilus trossulus TaxID=6551 RepID=UPI003007AEA8
MTEAHGLPPLPKCFNGLLANGEKVLNGVDHDAKDKVKDADAIKIKVPVKTERHNETEKNASPFSRLNVALNRLKDEMVGLRQLDMSLLSQLWSLNDAIQDYKAVVQERCSETNSEYSWGMNSRTSSIGSMDDYDWNADIHLQPENHVPNSVHSSTSSLLQQINELKQRAETEF